MNLSKLSKFTAAMQPWPVRQSVATCAGPSTPIPERNVGKANVYVRAIAVSILGLAGVAFAQDQKLPAQDQKVTTQEQKVVAPAPTEATVREAWRTSMSRTRPPNKGCFHASYPSSEWRSVPCTTAPPRPYRQRPVLQHANPLTQGKQSEAVGNSNDYELQSAGLISEAIGVFYNVSGVTSASGSSFSLQLNSNFFTTSACNGAADPSSCQGWEQFVYSNSGSLFIQDWLINYGTTCPSGWNTFNSDCWENGVAVSAPVEAITNLANLGLTGLANGGTDTIFLSLPGGDMNAMEQDSVLNLEQGWSAAEFNVFGDCCSSEVSFNSGVTIVPEVRVEDGTNNIPTCAQYGTTGETNSLNLTAPCCPYVANGTVPSIQFIETNFPNPAAVCGGGAQVTGVSLTVSNPSQTTPLSLGHSMTYTANVTPLNGYGGSVGLSMVDLPAGLSYSFSPQTIEMSGSSTLTLTAAYSTSTYVGSSTAYVNGTAVGLDDFASLPLSTEPLQYKGDCGVQGPSVKSLSARANPLALKQNGSSSGSLRKSAQNGEAIPR